MAKTVNVPCPKCRTELRFEKGAIWGWGSAYCSTCRRKIEPKEVRNTSLYCKYCGKTISVNLFSEEEPKCPNCRRTLTVGQTKAEPRRIYCPECGGYTVVAGGEEFKGVSCVRCGTYIDKIVDPEIAEANYTASAIRITSEGMPENYVLWRHPAQEFSAGSLLILPAGMEALLVSGSECLAVVKESGRRIGEFQSGQTVYCNVIFVRMYLGRSLLAGLGGISLCDERFRIKAGTPIKTNCALKLKISDSAGFAKEMNYRNCTEQDLGLRVPHIDSYRDDVLIKLNFEQCLRTACARTMQECRVDLLGLNDRRDVLVRQFINAAAEEVRAKGSLAVIDGTLDGFQIPKDALEVNDDAWLPSVLTRSFCWGPVTAGVHLETNSDYRANVICSGEMQLKIVDAEKLNGHEDTKAWKLSEDKEAPIRTIRRWVDECISGMLQGLLQDRLAANPEMAIDDLTLFTGGINTKISDLFATSDAYNYLWEHGLEVGSLTLSIDRIEKNDLLRQSEILRQNKEKTTMAYEYDNFVEDTEAEDRIRRAARNTNVTIQTDDMKEQLDEANYSRRMREIERDRKLADALHQATVAEKQRHAELQRIDDTNRNESAMRDYEFQRTNDTYEKEREISASQHEKTITELMLGIESGKLSFQEKLDAYTRAKMQQDALSEADVKRKTAAGEADIKRILGESEMKLAQAAQVLVEEAAQAEQAREEHKKQTEFDRNLAMRHQTLEAELEKLRLQEEMRQHEREAEARRFETEKENEMLKLMLDFYERKMKNETDAARANAAAEEARRKAQSEYERRQNERQKNDRAEREKAQRQRDERAEKDRQHLTKMLEELRSLQREINRAFQSGQRGGEAVDKMNELEDMMQDLMRKLSEGGEDPNRRYEDRRDGNGGRKTNREETGARRDFTRQPGLRQTNICPRCGSSVSRYAHYCPFCDEKLLD